MEEVTRHTHNGIDSEKIDIRELIKPTTDALTAIDTGTVNSGDSTTDDVIDNIRTRLNELEAILQKYKLIK